MYRVYVGSAKNLKQRIIQHLVRRESSVVTGASAVMVNPELITAVEWWEEIGFANSSVLRAAELVAFDILSPVLKSRGKIPESARRLHAESSFRRDKERLFTNQPSGRMHLPSLQDALNRISRLEKKLDALK